MLCKKEINNNVKLFVTNDGLAIHAGHLDSFQKEHDSATNK